MTLLFAEETFNLFQNESEDMCGSEHSESIENPAEEQFCTEKCFYFFIAWRE